MDLTNAEIERQKRNAEAAYKERLAGNLERCAGTYQAPLHRAKAKLLRETFDG